MIGIKDQTEIITLKTIPIYPKACQWLASKKIKLIALDCPQPDNPKNSKGSPCDAENHKVFLGKILL